MSCGSTVSNMGKSVGFWTTMWVVLLLPLTLFIMGMLATRGRAQSQNAGENVPEGLPFARLFTGLSCILPILEMLLSLLPEGALRAIGPSIMIFIPILGGLSGISGAILSGISGRGVERWTAPTACLIAIALLVALALAGAAAV